MKIAYWFSKKKWVKTPPLINFMHVGKRNRSRSTDIHLCQMRILCPLKLWMLSVFRLLKLRCIFSETVTSCCRNRTRREKSSAKKYFVDTPPK